MINERMRSLGACRSVIREIFEYGKKRKSEIGEDRVFDFSLGNPSVAPPSEVSDTLLSLIKNTEPTALHGYTSAVGEDACREAISRQINERYNQHTTKDCIYMAVGAAGALASVLCAVVTDGEEVIVLTPYFPEYKVFIESADGICTEVPTTEGDFLPDVKKIEDKICEKTAAIIINSPNNPTGALYGSASVKALTDMLKRKEKELSKSIYLISDEPYRELIYSDKEYPFVFDYYKNSIITYSYSKSLSLPGERIGYAMVCPDCPDFTAVYDAVSGAARSLGYVCAPSLLQKLVTSVTGLCSDISAYSENRRILADALTEYGFEFVNPDGAFYLFMKSPVQDAKEFAKEAKKVEILLVPSDSFGTAGYVRISYCVSKKVIEGALPAFKALSEKYGLRKKQRR